MKCSICNSLIENNNCYFCNIRYNKNKTIQDRHCWNIEEYKIHLEDKKTNERKRGITGSDNSH